MIDRRNFIIRSIGAAICAGTIPRFLPSLLPEGLTSGVAIRAMCPSNAARLQILYELLEANIIETADVQLLVPKSEFNGCAIANPFFGCA
jgi:hypothetical protein